MPCGMSPTGVSPSTASVAATTFLQLSQMISLRSLQKPLPHPSIVHLL